MKLAYRARRKAQVFESDLAPVWLTHRCGLRCRSKATGDAAVPVKQSFSTVSADCGLAEGYLVTVTPKPKPNSVGAPHRRRWGIRGAVRVGPVRLAVANPDFSIEERTMKALVSVLPEGRFGVRDVTAELVGHAVGGCDLGLLGRDKGKGRKEDGR